MQQADLVAKLRAGVVIPAHPLALSQDRQIDWRSQRALTRYYLDSGASGLAVGVHTTQFELHDDHGMLAEVYQSAAAEATAHAEAKGEDRRLLIAGIAGDTEQAVTEAQLAAEAGYDAILVAGRGTAGWDEDQLIERTRAIGEVLPTLGFYLQESVGGRLLSRDYWSRLFEVPTVVGAKAAPFDRYRSHDLVTAMIESDRWQELAYLTGNDDTIVHDLITPFRREVNGEDRVLYCHGGLLGEWAVGTRAAVGLLDQVLTARDEGSVSLALLSAAPEVVEVNAAVFDTANNFAGCVAGINEMLRQQGVIDTAVCLSDNERLSPGQDELIAQVLRIHPDWCDQQFVAQNRDHWRS
ncbi:dihydrodipicolinate synthase family protein [Parenemella sanctibonifatiensis]|uniref:Dihydrodipicolinate synthase family protein n=1 Tax=Parenemella sanctibonifatiensis TaxID=2016505 RepID=A0A255EKV8_9ACTN|nr:dihydrodipicolinate synthase family protein [Parenemella sanctibonifatiensis]OYN92178.1 dihydrodipicolinate synthase family protein [Parenemella sanctibonifatiensis]